MPQAISRPLRSERRLIFGDAYQAQLIDVTEGNIDPHTGEKIITFRFVPLEYLRWRHQITDDQYTNKTEWWIEKTYPKKVCYQLNKSPFVASWLVLQTYDGKEGLEIAEINKELEMRYEDIKHRFDIQKMMLAKVREILKDFANIPDYVMDKKVQDLEKMFLAGTASSQVPRPPSNQNEENTN